MKAQAERRECPCSEHSHEKSESEGSEAGIWVQQSLEWCARRQARKRGHL